MLKHKNESHTPHSHTHNCNCRSLLSTGKRRACARSPSFSRRLSCQKAPASMTPRHHSTRVLADEGNYPSEQVPKCTNIETERASEKMKIERRSQPIARSRPRRILSQQQRWQHVTSAAVCCIFNHSQCIGRNVHVGTLWCCLCQLRTPLVSDAPGGVHV